MITPLNTFSFHGFFIPSPPAAIKGALVVFNYLQNVDVSEILAGLINTLDHGLLALTDPDTWIVELLVGLAGTIGVSDLGLEVAL